MIALPASEWPSDTQVHWYDVEGDTASELRASLDARGPATPDGVRHDAYTSWFVTLRIPTARTDEGCVPGPVTATVRVTITLPRWRGFADGDPLTARWRRHLDALKEHESGHRDNGFRAAAHITDLLPSLPARPTCEEAEAEANQVALEVVERYRKQDVEYDQETHHGETQGAVFP